MAAAGKSNATSVEAPPPDDLDHSPSHPLERLIFFSDAVFAIAITLLIIEIVPPHLPSGSSDSAQLIALAQLSPQIIGFFISFAVIGAFWAGHHRSFCLARHWSRRLVAPNLMLLAAIVFMPFATAYSNANYGQRVPTIFYVAVLLAIGLLNVRLTRLVTTPEVVGEDADPLRIAQTRVRGWGVVAGAAVALITAWFAPGFALATLVSIPFWQRLIIRMAERRLRQGTG